MDTLSGRSSQMFRLWIATYTDWRPSRWNESPPRATALELVENALYSADEAAMFLEGFNGSMLEHDQPIWAVAVPIKVHYEGDAQPGTIVEGYVFADEHAATDACPNDQSAAADMRGGIGAPDSVPDALDSVPNASNSVPDALGSAPNASNRAADALNSGPLGDQVQGFGQSPQRSR